MSVSNLMGVGLGAATAKIITGVLADNLTATGTGQADALSLPGDINVVSLVFAGGGVKLPSSPQPGDSLLVTNIGANTLLIYPSVGGSIQGGAANTPFTLPVGSSATFTARRGSLNWVALASSGSVGAGPAASDPSTFLLLLEEA